jgi:hypothetical protein
MNFCGPLSCFLVLGHKRKEKDPKKSGIYRRKYRSIFMPVPSTNVTLGGIYSEPNGATAANTKASEIMKATYFQGPGPIGSGTYSFRSWGQYGNTAGADRIYGLTGSNVNNNFGAFRGLTYYYDNSSYKVALRLINNKQNPPYPPPPPIYDNTIAIEIFLYDSTDTYQYLVSGGINAGSQTDTNHNITTGTGNEPIIAIGYWEVKVTVGEAFPAGGTLDLTINGTNYGGGGLAQNAQTTFRWNDPGATAAPVNVTGQGYDGLYFVATIG